MRQFLWGMAQSTVQKNFMLRFHKNCMKNILIYIRHVWKGHALCDMAGDDEKSWKNQVIAHGYVCEPYLKGLAESAEIQNIWIKRIEQAILAL